MIKVFKLIKNPNKVETKFLMPLSLRLIKECSDYKISNYEKIHFADLLSIIYSYRIDNAKRYLETQRRDRMNKRGIADIRTASERDFDNL